MNKQTKRFVQSKVADTITVQKEMDIFTVDEFNSYIMKIRDDKQRKKENKYFISKVTAYLIFSNLNLFDWLAKEISIGTHRPS